MADEPTGTTAPTTDAPVAPAATDKTFTQADLDRIVADRLKRQAAQFGDIEELREKAKRLEEIEAKSQSETEKLLARIEKTEKAATEREQRAAEREGAADLALKRASVIAEATRQNAANPDTVFKLLDPAKLTLGDDGQISGVEEAVKGLIEAEPYLVGSRAPQAVPGAFGGGPQGAAAPSGSSMDDLIRQSIHQGSGE